jgi:chromate reductase
MVPLQQPEAYIGNVHKLLNEDGSVKEEKTKGYFQSIVDAFVQLIESTEQPK